MVAPARTYPILVKPISLMCLEYEPTKERVRHRYPFFRSTFFERRMLFDVAAMARPRQPVGVSEPRPEVRSDNVATV